MTAPDPLTQSQMEKEFVENWLNDALTTAAAELGEEARIRLIEGAGRACFQRWEFKRSIAEAGRGDVDKLVEAMRRNFECWREGESLVHIRYGEVSQGCYCPVLKNFPHTADDAHCHCTKAMHQAMFEAALGTRYPVEIVESVRRGGKTCHFIVHLDEEG
jgi:ketosteroid isomerase-like protein